MNTSNTSITQEVNSFNNLENINTVSVSNTLSFSNNYITPNPNIEILSITQSTNQVEATITNNISYNNLEVISKYTPSNITFTDINSQGMIGAKGDKGDSLDFIWEDTRLGVKRETESSFSFSELKGSKGDNLTFNTLTDQQKLELRGDVGSTETNYVNIFLDSLLN